MAARTAPFLPDPVSGEIRARMYASGLLHAGTGLPRDWLLEAAGQHTLTPEDESRE